MTYAAVAAKFSTRFASVTKLKQRLNVAVKAHTTPNLAVMFRTNARTTIAAIGINEETSVPRIVAMRWKCVSRYKKMLASTSKDELAEGLSVLGRSVRELSDGGDEVIESS